MTIARHRHFHGRGAEEHRRELVDDESLGAEDDLVAGTEESLGKEDHHLVGTVADDEITGLEGPLLGQLLAQEGAAAVRVEMAMIEGLLGGGETQRRRAERVLVGRELDDGARIQAELAGDDFDGTSRLIDGLGEDGPVR